jgi:hypothetical protein
MDRARLTQRVLWIVAAAIALGGCGATLPGAAPGGAPEAPPAGRLPGASRSWMAPGSKAENLLYVADPGTGGVVVYTYAPPKFKFAGFLSGAASPAGECVDKQQNVYVTNHSFANSHAIFKYAHGGTDPIAILGDPAGMPIYCAVDPKTNDLAVIDYPFQNGGPTLAIYRNGHGKPELFTKPGFGMVSCTYDDRGNLFIDGDVIGGFLQFTELPAGRHDFERITLHQQFEFPGSIQWDGRDIAAGDFRAGTIYRFRIEGKKGTEVGTTPLPGSVSVSQFSIMGRHIVVPSARPQYAGYVKIYDYPAGGHSTRTLWNFSTPVGVAISLRSADR